MVRGVRPGHSSPPLHLYPLPLSSSLRLESQLQILKPDLPLYIHPLHPRQSIQARQWHAVLATQPPCPPPRPGQIDPCPEQVPLPPRGIGPLLRELDGLPRQQQEAAAEAEEAEQADQAERQERPADDPVAALAGMLARHPRQEVARQVLVGAAEPERGLHAGDLCHRSACCGASSSPFLLGLVPPIAIIIITAAALVVLRLPIMIPSSFLCFLFVFFLIPFRLHHDRLLQMLFDDGRVIGDMEHDAIAEVVDANVFVLERRVGEAGEGEV